MLSRLIHRGPDDQGSWVEGLVGLGHTRLSIIDLATGHQPLCNEDGGVWVVFNGEVFNYKELRSRLIEQGHRFRTESDTEVIVHLYEEHGERFVEYLNGQFAIALWDRVRRRLVLARDRNGIRPLFYIEIDGRLAFASEIKALFALPMVGRALDPRAIAEICTFWSPLAPRTVFSNVNSLPPGCLMVVDGTGCRTIRYWDWDFSCLDVGRTEDDYIEELRALLTDAVRLQLRADVPVGTYLSGGLDSAIITALAQREGAAALRTFSITFDDAEFDESIHQNTLVDYLGTQHSALHCSRSDIAAAFPRTVYQAETPVVRTAPTPLMLLSGHVRQCGYKVVLTGEGADEVFGGYDLFKEAKIRRFWGRFPGSAIRPRILERLYPYLKNSPASGRAFSRAFFGEGMDQAAQPYFAHIPRWTTTGRISRFFSADLRNAIGQWDPYRSILETLPNGIGNWSPMGRDQYVEAHTLMSGYLLCSQGDRVAMANSVEGRVPFLDHRLIEFANRLPPHLKLRGLTEKYLLKKAAADWLPKSVLTRTKQPYRAPDSQAFFEKGVPVGYVAEMFDAKHLADAGYFDPGAVSKLFEKCRAGRAIGFADNMAFVAILSTMLLHDQFVRKDAAVPGYS